MLGLAIAIAIACGKKEDAQPAASTPAPPPAAATPPAAPDPHHAADPHHPHAAADPMGTDDRSVSRTAKGTIELTIDDTPQRLDFLSYGRNAAVWVPKTGVSRVTISGAETHAGMPALSITLSGVRLDQVRLPLTIGGDADGEREGEKGPPAPQIVWQVGEKRIYRSQGGPDAPEVVLKSYADGRVAGSFEGTLVMGDGKLDPPVKVRGTFDVSLRLNGVAPSRAD